MKSFCKMISIVTSPWSEGAKQRERKKHRQKDLKYSRISFRKKDQRKSSFFSFFSRSEAIFSFCQYQQEMKGNKFKFTLF
jgi:hypothetical protein